MTDGIESQTQPLEGQPLAEAAAITADKKRKKKRAKVRSAWISFVGRIVAQIMGAVATIALGLLVVHHYKPGRVSDADQQTTVQTQIKVEPASARVVTPGSLSIAVLPLETFSGRAPEGFADAMTETLTANLARAKELRVISRTSAMQYKSHRRTVPTIAKELGVDLVLEGSIAVDGDRVRIIAQLIDARRDEHVWAESYDRSLSDVLTTQAEVATAIARAVSKAVTGNQDRSIKRTSDPERNHVPAAAVPTPVSTSGPGAPQ
jgi:TolB-like protein